MISIRLNSGEYLDMGGASISFTLVSPVFSGEIGYGSQSFSFSIPNTANNSRILDEADKISTRGNMTEFEVVLGFDGAPIERATLTIEKTSPDTFNCSLLLRESTLSGKLEEKTLREYEYGGERQISQSSIATTQSLEMISHANATTSATYQGSDYVFAPIRNEGMYPDSTVTLGPIHTVNWWWDGSFFDEQTWENDPDNVLGQKGVQVLVPFVYLRYVLSQILTENGFSLDIQAWSNGGEMDTLVLYNPHSLLAYGDPDYDLAKGTISIPDHLPQINSREFFRALRDMFGLVPIIDNKRVTLKSLKDIATDTDQVDWRDKTVSYFTEFSTQERQRFGSVLDESDETSQEIPALEDVDNITVSVPDVASLPNTPGQENRFVISENAYYTRIDGVWQRLGYRYLGQKGGQEVQEIDEPNPISTLPGMYAGDWFDGSTWRIPLAKQQLNGKQLDIPAGIRREDFSTRLLFYRGLVGAPQYPQLTVDDDAGTYEYSLLWHGERGIYARWLKAWDDLLHTSKKATFTLRLSAGEAFDVDYTKRHRIRTHEGEVVGYIEKIGFNLQNAGVGLATVKMRIV